MNFNNLYKDLISIFIMKVKIFVLLGIVLFSFINVVDASSTVVDFIIGGCTFNFESETIGLVKGQCSDDPAGELYCDANGVGWVTTEPGFGCSMGDINWEKGKGCCPEGYFCNKTGDGDYAMCYERMVNCIDNKDKTSCEDDGCEWLYEKDGSSLVVDGICVDNVKDYSCAYYLEEDYCNEDRYRIAKRGVGAGPLESFFECAGDIYSVPVNKYKCNWTVTNTGGECRFTYSAVQTGIFLDAEQNIFSCLKSYDVGECDENGEQKVSWTSGNKIEQGFADDDVIPEECLVAFGCETGSTIRKCGQDIIKLPGFSLFALIGSLCVIVVYYFFREH